jgi:rhombotail lipoprotein
MGFDACADSRSRFTLSTFSAEVDMNTKRVLFAVLIFTVVLGGCVASHRQVRSNALEFLYPDGTEATPPTDVALDVPVRVGIAFAPGTYADQSFTADRKQALLQQIAAAFEAHDDIAGVEVVPPNFLTTGGGFAELDRLRNAFGIDVLALLSYDQVQFQESGRAAWTYWTIIGAYVVKGEKNETRTMLNAVVFDIPSRALLFQATGQSSQKGRSTLVGSEGAMRKQSDTGFDAATTDLIAQLGTALDAFSEQAKTGTVRGAGTPEIVVRRDGTVVSGGGVGAGALGPVEALGAALLLIAAACGRRRRAAS